MVLWGLLCLLPETFAQVRHEFLLEKGWRFTREDQREAFADPAYDDAAWQSVTVPHDWAIYGPFSAQNDKQQVAIAQDGQKEALEHAGRTGGLPFVGVGWYRIRFEAPAFGPGKRAMILFDGAMSNAEVYLNGKKVGYWPYGYNSFYFDVTDCMRANAANTLAVRLENLPESSRWYPGAGLYRNVHVIVTDDAHIPVWGTRVTTPKVTKDFAKVKVETEIALPEGADPARYTLRTVLYDPNQQQLIEIATSLAQMKYDDNRANQEFNLPSPSLWSPDSPALYTAESRLFEGDQLRDTYRTTFGIRSIELVPDKGFFLNGEKFLFKGVCNHHDLGPLGAAVNEAVTLARKVSRNPRSAGLVNAVLRGIARAGEHLQQPRDLATRYSHPEWLVKEFSLALGEDVEPLLAADNTQPPITAQVNTCRVPVEQVEASLAAQGVSVQRHPWLEGCLILSETGNLEGLEAFSQGWIYIQDPAARLAVMAAGPRPGMRVLDACAAPGGKSFAAAIAMGNQGEVLSRDLHPHKEKLIRAGATRLGLSCIHTAVADAKVYEPALEGIFDLVIADVPCSGLGIIRKKPDIRYKDPAPLAGLPRVQGEILEHVARYVRPGGILLYATCTLLERENGGVVRGFLDRCTNFTLTGFTLPGPVGEVPTGMCTLWPHRHGTDGFFFARLERRADGTV